LQPTTAGAILSRPRLNLNDMSSDKKRGEWWAPIMCVTPLARYSPAPGHARSAALAARAGFLDHDRLALRGPWRGSPAASVGGVMQCEPAVDAPLGRWFDRLGPLGASVSAGSSEHSGYAACS
jgi:hypothetical protein